MSAGQFLSLSVHFLRFKQRQICRIVQFHRLCAGKSIAGSALWVVFEGGEVSIKNSMRRVGDL